MHYTITSCGDSLYVSVPLVLHHSASGYVLKKLASNYFSKEATVIDQNDISSHGIYSASNFTACICTKILSGGHSSGDFYLLTLRKVWPYIPLVYYNIK